MTSRRSPVGSRLLTRLTVIGMAMAVLALGGLAVWSAFVMQREAAALSRSGVQITGQLRALQALYVIRTETDALEEGVSADRLNRLREALRALPEQLTRMQTGDSPEAIRVAGLARPLADRLAPAVERFLADPRSDINNRGENGSDVAEDAMETIIDELEVLLDDARSDPADLIAGKLAKAVDAGVAVRQAAAVLIPVGLGGVIVCAWLLHGYRRRSEAALQLALETSEREARTDQLTGLPNRRAVLEELDRRVAGAEPFIFALADLNGFKQYNDTFGHPAGDALLHRLGTRLSAEWAGDGYAARLGGDEFCVIADHVEPALVQARLQDALTDEGEGFKVSAESGLASVPDEAVDASAALTLADGRLYTAKALRHATADASVAGRTSDRHPARE